MNAPPIRRNRYANAGPQPKADDALSSGARAVDVLADGVVVDIVSRDCGYGFSAHTLMADGSQAFHTTRLHASREQAEQETAALARMEPQS